jgi:putative isomerase
VAVELAGRETGMRVRVLEPGGEGAAAVEIVEAPDAGYRIRTPAVLLPPAGVVSRYALVTVADRQTAGDRPEAELLADPEPVLAANQERWSGYLARVVGGRGAAGAGGRSSAGGMAAPGSLSAPDAAAASSQAAEAVPSAPDPAALAGLAAKAVQTLISNWRAARGHLYHDGLFPSYAYRGFHGVWSWDSWKHARALALFAPELAKDQLRVMLDHQDPGGMIPDVIYVDSAENNWRDTKPPLAAWAAHGIFRATGDTRFVAEVYPALLAFHEWWYRERDHDRNGLCEYGSSDGTLVAAAWESGMDNAVRFDDARMVRNGPRAWSMDRESVDLNAYLFAEKGYLADLAQALGKGSDAARLRAEAERLGELIRSTHFDRETGWFYDVRLEDKAPVRVQGPEGWIPLWAGVATREQADRVARVMTDSARFAGPVPFPTLAMDHPQFDPLDGYWRGPVWLDQAHFAVSGLERCGHRLEAARLRARLFQAPRGLLDGAPIYENYHPRTGEGLNAPHFSWSAAHLLLLLAEER